MEIQNVEDISTDSSHPDTMFQPRKCLHRPDQFCSVSEKLLESGIESSDFRIQMINQAQ